MESKMGTAVPDVGRSLLGVTDEVPDGPKIRSSLLAARPVGAAPPCQLAGLLQLVLPPFPVQIKLAGARRLSSCSRLKMRRALFFPLLLSRKRNNEFNRQVNRMDRSFSTVPRCLSPKSAKVYHVSV